MQFRYFHIPAGAPAEMEEEMNRFLRTVRVLRVRHEFVVAGGFGHWYALVEYQAGAAGDGSGESRVNRRSKDYKELLPPEDFALFSKLREWRKARAAREEIPVYTVLTNEQLARLAGLRPQNLAGLQEIEGLGEARRDKYGSEILAVIAGMKEAGE